MPQDLDALVYPVTLQYHRGGVVFPTAPRIQLRDWREELVHLVAHEAFHTRQFREQLPKFGGRRRTVGAPERAAPSESVSSGFCAARGPAGGKLGRWGRLGSPVDGAAPD